MIGGYSMHMMSFILTDEDNNPYIIDASLGSFDYTISSPVSTDIVDITMYDAADAIYFFFYHCNTCKPG
ncbi:MAG: hypothetical protein R2744_09730 [Bacteroidales bacterium]